MMKGFDDYSIPSNPDNTSTHCAIFDLDGTLLDCDSFFLWLRYLMVRRPTRLCWRIVPMIIDALCFKAGWKSNHWAKKRFLTHLAGGLKRHQAEALCRPWVERLLAKHLREDALRVLRHHQKQGNLTILATASPDLYANLICRLLDMDLCLATRLHWTLDHCISGQLVGDNCYGEVKRDMVVEWLKKSGRMAADGTCHVTIDVWSDHHSDLPLLLIADQGYAINPTPKLKQLASSHSLNVIHWN
jgi:phosphatidylglycerophosphatase C